MRPGATSATVIMVYVGIDVMGHLSMPAAKTSATRQDFIAWVDKYLRAEPDSAYQYEQYVTPHCCRWPRLLIVTVLLT